MTVYLGIDDTDNHASRGTGRLARSIAGELAAIYHVSGVTRHQLYVHDAIPYTSHNSCAVIHIEGAENGTLREIHACARAMVLDDFVEGSDPGIAVASADQVTDPLVAFGARAKDTVLSQDEARVLARESGVLLEGLGGTNDGIIGALAGIGLASSRNDGRFVSRCRTRELSGCQTVADLLGAGIDSVMTTGGKAVTSGVVEIRKFPKPALRQGRAILYVEDAGGVYRDLVVG
jgi:hypothetical protein